MAERKQEKPKDEKQIKPEGIVQGYPSGPYQHERGVTKVPRRVPFGQDSDDGATDDGRRRREDVK